MRTQQEIDDLLILINAYGGYTLSRKEVVAVKYEQHLEELPTLADIVEIATEHNVNPNSRVDIYDTIDSCGDSNGWNLEFSTKQVESLDDYYDRLDDYKNHLKEDFEKKKKHDEKLEFEKYLRLKEKYEKS